jgi:hypothetical protein
MEKHTPKAAEIMLRAVSLMRANSGEFKNNSSRIFFGDDAAMIYLGGIARGVVGRWGNTSAQSLIEYSILENCVHFYESEPQPWKKVTLCCSGLNLAKFIIRIASYGN